MFYLFIFIYKIFLKKTIKVFLSIVSILRSKKILPSNLYTDLIFKIPVAKRQRTSGAENKPSYSKAPGLRNSSSTGSLTSSGSARKLPASSSGSSLKGASTLKNSGSAKTATLMPSLVKRQKSGRLYCTVL